LSYLAEKQRSHGEKVNPSTGSSAGFFAAGLQDNQRSAQHQNDIDEIRARALTCPYPLNSIRLHTQFGRWQWQAWQSQGSSG